MSVTAGILRAAELLLEQLISIIGYNEILKNFPQK